LSFRSPVRGVHLRRERIIVVLENKIFVYNFADLKAVAPDRHFEQPQGPLRRVTAARKGQVRVEHYKARKTKFINAHTSRIACFVLSQDGRLIATATTKGTLVRIYNASEGNLLHEKKYLMDNSSSFPITSLSCSLTTSNSSLQMLRFRLNFEAASISPYQSVNSLPPPALGNPNIRRTVSFRLCVLLWECVYLRHKHHSHTITSLHHSHNMTSYII
ncbi:hypothetical protein ACJX0J_024992, partial [Zea mays]